YLSSILPIVLQRFSASTTKPETEFDRMVKQRAAWMIEAQKLNTPSTFVEYAKLQRRIDKLSNQIDSYKKGNAIALPILPPKAGKITTLRLRFRRRRLLIPKQFPQL
ncbi:hypothetical protein BVRB_039020, partial [Beta vulgaris subsp. vulgaris]